MTADPLGALRALVDAANEVDAAYAIIGAVARNAWAPPRATADLDCAVSVDSVIYMALIEALARRGFTIRNTVTAEPGDPIPDVVLLDHPEMVVRRVDLLVSKTSFEREAVAQAVPRDIGVRCRVVRAEHLVVYKLIAHRPRDLADVEEILKTRRLAEDPVDLSVVRRWAAEWGATSTLDKLLEQLDLE